MVGKVHCTHWTFPFTVGRAAPVKAVSLLPVHGAFTQCTDIKDSVIGFESLWEFLGIVWW